MPRRRGFNLLECTIAAAVLVTLMGLCAKFLTATAAQRRYVEWRETAVREAANAMERLAAQPWELLTPEALAGQRLSQEAIEFLPEAELKCEVAADGDARRVTAVVRWQPPSGQPQSYRLTAWRYRTSPRFVRASKP